MARKRAPIDLWLLFKEGRSAGIVFGETDIDGVRRALGVRRKGYEGRLPFSSWVLAAEQAEVFFQGRPERIYSVKVHPSTWTLSGEAADVLEWEGTSDEHAGLVPIVVDGKPLSQFSTMRRLFQNCSEPDRLKLRCYDEKQFELSVVEEGRSIVFGYRAEARLLARQQSMIDFDYFLYAVWLFDGNADAELSKSLPAGTETREQVISRVANTGRRSGDEECTSN